MKVTFISPALLSLDIIIARYNCCSIKLLLDILFSMLLLCFCLHCLQSVGETLINWMTPDELGLVTYTRPLLFLSLRHLSEWADLLVGTHEGVGVTMNCCLPFY